MKILNTKGEVFFGLHFCPGVAEYAEPNGEAFRVFLNEATIRKMDQSFKGCPVFVQHVDDVNGSLDRLRAESDGWVVKSFYNEADGKHWVEFIITSEKGLQAIKNGLRLSNCYKPTGPYGPAGLWNGVQYDREILNGEYEHLALVPNPRYDESMIKNEKEFQEYNDRLKLDLKRVANSKSQGEGKMKLNFFKRAKVENDLNIEELSVLLPTSKKEVTISSLVEKMDKIENMAGYCNEEHLVKMDNGEDMSVAEMKKKFGNMAKEMEDMKKSHDEEGSEMENDVIEEDTVREGKKDVGDRGGDKSLDNEDEDKEEKEEEAKKKNASDKAARLKNAGAHLRRDVIETPLILTMDDKVARGKILFGKN